MREDMWNDVGVNKDERVTTSSGRRRPSSTGASPGRAGASPGRGVSPRARGRAQGALSSRVKDIVRSCKDDQQTKNLARAKSTEARAPEAFPFAHIPAAEVYIYLSLSLSIYIYINKM